MKTNNSMKHKSTDLMTVIRKIKRNLTSLFFLKDTIKNSTIKTQNAALIIDSNSLPNFYDSEDIFIDLQNHYSGPGEYNYDSYSVWERGVNRASELLNIGNLKQFPKKILEIGGGDGMTLHALSCYGHQVKMIDMDDWRDERAQILNFDKVNLNNPIPIQEEQYDFIFSYNTFEHLPDPELTLKEVFRLCKKGGNIFLEFGPLYASPWGLHAYRSLKMPYPQFLFSPDFISDKLKILGINDLGNENRQELQYVNKWTFKKYRKLFDSYGDNILSFKTYEDKRYIDFITKYPQAFTGQNLTLEDVYTTHIKVLFKKL